MSIFHFRELWNGHRAKILISAAAFLFGSALILLAFFRIFQGAGKEPDKPSFAPVT